MTTEAKQAPEGAENADDVAGQFAEADTAADPSGEEQDPVAVEDIAARMGWVPKEKFRGEETKWKPADQFILDGKDIQDRLSREVKSVRETLDTIKETNASILKERLTEQHEQLSRRYAAAVEKGDPDAAFAIGNEIVRVQAAANQPQRSVVAPETQAWVAKNPRLMSDPLARQRAVQICDVYARDNPNMPAGEQLANTEARMRVEFPYLFEDKAPAQVNGNISRNSSAPAKTGKTSADLPREARAQADDLVERGLIGSTDDYAKHYFAAQAKGR